MGWDPRLHKKEKTSQFLTFILLSFPTADATQTATDCFCCCALPTTMTISSVSQNELFSLNMLLSRRFVSTTRVTNIGSYPVVPCF